MTAASILDRSVSSDSVVDTESFHLGLNVQDLDRSVRFYVALFGQQPFKHLADYAKFEVADPPLVVALYLSPQSPGGALNHVGLRLLDSVQLVEIQRRLEEAGIPTQRQDDVECCYSRQTKFWISDPDRNLWEIYTHHEDLEHSGFDDVPAKFQVAASEAVWEHRITEPVPHSLSFADSSLDEVRLEGTFNVLLPEGVMRSLLTEIRRVLKAGGRIVVHGLVGDRPFPGTPQLPGMASMVQHVPVETEPLQLIRDVGFEDLLYDKLGDIHCFQVNGVVLRELRLSATKPESEDSAAATIIYRGPFPEIELDNGLILRRGEMTTIPETVARRLMTGPAATSFGLIRTESRGEV